MIPETTKCLIVENFQIQRNCTSLIHDIPHSTMPFVPLLPMGCTAHIYPAACSPRVAPAPRELRLLPAGCHFSPRVAAAPRKLPPQALQLLVLSPQASLPLLCPHSSSVPTAPVPSPAPVTCGPSPLPVYRNNTGGNITETPIIHQAKGPHEPLTLKSSISFSPFCFAFPHQCTWNMCLMMLVIDIT